MRAELKMDVAWVEVCALDDILPNTGVACLVAGRQIAVFRVRSIGAPEDEVFATENYDPFSEANVIARGIVGCRAGQPKVASPMYKQSFCLRTGACFDDPSVSIEVFPVRVAMGRVLVRSSATHKLRARNADLLSERGA